MKARGNSLSEILITLFIASFMTAVMAKTYVSMKLQYLWQEKKLSEAQDNFLLMDWLKGQIQSSGIIGCNHLSAMIQEAAPLERVTDKGLLVLSSQDKRLPSAVRRNGVKNSAVLLLKQVKTPLYAVMHTQKNSEVIKLHSQSALKVNQEVVLSDCQYAQISKIRTMGASKTMLALDEPLTRQYQSNAVLGLLNTSIIYVRRIGKVRALYVSDGKRSEELARDITKLIVTKKVGNEKSLVYVELQRSKSVSLHFYKFMYGQ